MYKIVELYIVSLPGKANQLKMAKITLTNFLRAKSKKRVQLGCLSLLSSLEKEGHKVRYIDLQTDLGEFEIDKCADLLLDNSDYLAVSSMSMMLPWLFETLKSVKRKQPNKVIILGGTGISSISELILKKMDFIDYAIEGEGETALNRLVSEIGGGNYNLDTVPNLVYRRRGEIKKNERKRENIEQLEMNYSLIKDKKYDDLSSIITARGCPYDCGFCYNKQMWSQKVRFKSTEKIFHEVDQILNLSGINHIKIVDDLFLFPKERVYKFFDKYKESVYDFRYQVMGAKIDFIDVDILTKLKDTNCISLWFGIESASDRILREINKNFTISEALLKLDLAMKYIPNLLVSFIVGYPFESIREFNETMQLSRKLYDQGFDVVINFLRPQNRTRIFNSYKEKIFLHEHASTIAPASLSPEIISAIEQDCEMYCWFYLYETPSMRDKLDIFHEFDIKPRPEIRRVLLETKGSNLDNLF